MVDLVFQLQAFQLENRVNRHKHLIVLRGDPACGRFCQRGIGFQGFMKHFDFPPFLVDCLDRIAITRQITANQIQQPRATILVCKDLPY